MTERSGTRIAMVTIAAAIVVSGLVLTVGAGARGGPSVRDASYPVSYAYAIKITDSPAKRSHSARFAFHAVYTETGQRPPHSNLKYYHYVCKLDDSKKKKCDSPKTYHGLSKGKHHFGVYLAANVTNTRVSKVKTVKWKVN